jgi:predicted N-acyltransferase
MRPKPLPDTTVEGDYRMRVVDDLSTLDAARWNRLAQDGDVLQPFLRHEFLVALEHSGCVGRGTGWLPRHLVAEAADGTLLGAVPLYEKHHSYGEYVFDWAWADAYRRHGLAYYPKLLSAIPFTPVGGRRLIARDQTLRAALLRALLRLAAAGRHSSLHVLFPHDDERLLLESAGMMIRRGLQFHWRNGQGGAPWRDFDEFLASLAQPKRKKIRAERRKVREAGITLRRVDGADIDERLWAFFTRCYDTTYAEHQSTPYLNRAFFGTLGRLMPENLLMVVASAGNEPLAASLIMHDRGAMYGRYWGALVHVPCLHFEVAYYQTIEAAIERGIPLIEGGAQGEHKMARGFLPHPTVSAHWLAEPAFAHAVDDFLRREGRMIGGYLDELRERQPFRDGGAAPAGEAR